MEYIKLAVEGNVGVLTVNRPAALNALNDQVIRELNEALDTIDLDTLNKAIQDLADVVEPLARFFNVFN